MSEFDASDRPPPILTPVEGILRAGLVHIDDSPSVRQVLRRAMYRDGVLVDGYNSFEDFLREPPPVLTAFLLDMELEDGLTGLELARRIQQRWPDLPIAFYTSELNAPRFDAARKIGPVFDKSSDLEAVMRWFLEQLQHRRLHARQG